MAFKKNCQQLLKEETTTFMVEPLKLFFFCKVTLFGGEGGMDGEMAQHSFVFKRYGFGG